MDYPHSFPDHLKPPIDAAFADAEIEFAKLQKEDHSKDDTIRHMKRFVRRVFLAFAHGACKAVEQRLWKPETMRSELDRFREDLSRHIYHDKSFWSSNRDELYQIDRSVKREIESLEEWANIQNELKDAISRASSSSPQLTPEKDISEKLSIAFPKRAAWLKQRLQERAWNKNDVARFGGPDRRTVQRILDGFRVREDGLEQLAHALSKKGRKVEPADIPSD